MSEVKSHSEASFILDVYLYVKEKLTSEALL